MLRRSALPRALITVVLAAAVAAPGGAAMAAAPPWIQEIEEVVDGRNVSVAVGFDGGWLYRRGARTARPPASNQKLLFSMTLLHRTSLDLRIRTQVFATGTRSGGRLRGDLWIVGHGDPELGKDDMAALARAIRDRGIRRIRGRVMGATTGFLRDWWAPGWRDYFPDVYIPLPTALTFEGNRDRAGRHVRDPERRAARSLTNRLRAIGVGVSGDPGAGVPPGGRRLIASVASDRLDVLVQRMNRRSRNFHAEVLGKWLGARAYGGPGSIEKGAATIERFGENHGVSLRSHDASGLSYWNRIRPEDLVRLLWFADAQPWGDELRFSLPTRDQGTLEDRLGGIRVRAKTGSLIEVSTLSGWVWLEQVGAWAEFSIMSQGMRKDEAAAIEDRIVRIVSRRATP